MGSLFRSASPLVWAWVGVVFAGALWGGGALAAHAALVSGMTPTGLALVRFALGAPLLWLWAWRASEVSAHQVAPWSAQPRAVRRLVLGAGVAMAVNVACWFLAIREMGAALSTVIAICCAPVFVAVLAAALGMERLGAWRSAVLVVAVSGTALVVWPADLASAALGEGAAWHGRGVAWALGSALSYAVVALCNARLPRTLPTARLAAWSMSAAAVCAALAVVATGGMAWPRTPLGWWAATYTGLVATGVAYLLFVAGTRHIGPTATVVGTLVEPLVAVGLAAWWLGEVLLWRQWLGGAMLCGAVAALALRRE